MENSDLFEDIIRCPFCRGSFISFKQTSNKDYIKCKKCNSKFNHINNFIDFLIINKVGSIEEVAISTWGEGNHKNNQKPATNHFKTINEKLEETLDKEIKGNVLDIGCGSGFDTKQLSELKNVKETFGIDIGSNAIKVAKQIPKAFIVRGTCLNLPFKDSKFDSIYSYGVFHHTSNPSKAISEASRVLKHGGSIFIYVYTSHNKNLPKKIGILIEKLLMKLFIYLPNKIRNFICICICPFAWIFFTVPSKLFKYMGFKNIASKLPMNWGTTPLSILPDIKDRLLAPVNYRYSIKSFSKLLKKSKLKVLSIKEDYSGVYVHASKE